jgi:Ran GTPase-activating protein (RanGAP) involved in mRNA processing and transport
MPHCFPLSLCLETQINLSRQGIGPAEARLLKEAIVINPHLAVLKLAYNNLGNEGAEAIAEALSACGQHQHGGGGGGTAATTIMGHHQNLSVLDVGFNEIGDAGCEALAVRVLAGNYTIKTLCLTANSIRVRGALALAGAIAHGTGLSRLLLAANPIRSNGLEAIATAIAKHDAKQIASLTASLAQYPGYPSSGGEPRVTLSGMEELDVGSSSIDSAGFISVPAMLLTNVTIQTLCLENNNLGDTDMALLSQSLAQNKNVPLRTLKLSFNQISCTGVECLMNAVWGSPTLRDLALDNNKIQDRGAQLCAVVLTSIALERLDLSFNRVTTTGLKALMKNVSENNSVQCLHLSGIPIDLNGSKAVSFALAYNNSLRSMYLDNCSTGYSSQRHIVAGIVSNRRSSLRVLTGFSIGRTSAAAACCVSVFVRCITNWFRAPLRFPIAQPWLGLSECRTFRNRGLTTRCWASSV